NSLKFDSIIDVTSGRISIKELGSGLENLLKTQLSLNQDNTDSAHLIVIEEPENHLTASNTRKQIDQLNNINNQIIVTTHNSYIVTGLDIENLIWIKEENGLKKQATIKSELSEETKEFFKRRDDVDFLRLLTAKKIILVEGAAEYILMRTFIKKVCKEDRLDFEILSIGGRHYQPFIDLAKYANNKMAIFTDNDADVEKPADKRINKIDDDNKKTESVKIFCDQQTKNYTFEVSEYNSNKSIIENKFPVNPYAKTSKHGDNDVASKQLAYMLNNKTESALAMLPNYEKEVYQIPEYIVKGLKWLKE
ncbi:TOPRIM nucleotidyl transferase/hydrolase domain-containing protein, partial [Lactobacillus crispatus]